jgi:hypothetical protein
VIFRRRRLPSALEAPFVAFRAVLAEVEPAKAALTEVIPTTRMPGQSLPDALIEFERGLAAGGGLMPGWRVPAVDSEWQACERGLRDALDRAKRFREEAPELGGFEGLIWAVEELLGPLEPFAVAAERFRELGAR